MFTNGGCQYPRNSLTPKSGIFEDEFNFLTDFRAFNDSYIKYNADQNADLRISGSSTLLGIVKLPTTKQNALIGDTLNLVIDSQTGIMGVGTPSGESTSGGMIVFSSGVLLAGASVPRLLGVGNSATETVNGSGESSVPSEPGGYSFPIPFAGTISNLQVSTDLFAITTSLLNTTGLQYDFTVFVSPSATNNGIDHSASAYVTTALTIPTAFGGLAGTTIIGSTYRSCTNLNTGSISVNAGDRVGVRVRMLTTGNAVTDGLVASEVGQISFNASLRYIKS
jgi:hypothetical protein